MATKDDRDNSDFLPVDFLEKVFPDVSSEKRDILRRQSDRAVMEMLHQLHTDIVMMDGKVQGMRDELNSHMRDETADLALAVAKLMNSAFPYGDPKSHREYHELQIETAKEKLAFRKKMLFELTKWGIFGFLGWAAVVLWRGFLMGPTK